MIIVVSVAVSNDNTSVIFKFLTAPYMHLGGINRLVQVHNVLALTGFNPQPAYFKACVPYCFMLACITNITQNKQITNIVALNT